MKWYRLIPASRGEVVEVEGLGEVPVEVVARAAQVHQHVAGDTSWPGRAPGHPSSASTAPRNADVCASTSDRSWNGENSDMLWNGASSTPRLTVQRWKNASSSSSTAAAASAPVRGGGQNQYSARQPSRWTCHGRSCWAMTSADAVGELLGQRDRDVEVLLPQGGGEGGPHGGHRERRPRQGAADAGDVDVVPEHRTLEPRGDLLGHAVGRDRDATSDGLADDHEVGVEAPGRGRPPGPAQIVCVSSLTSSTPWRRVTSRTPAR